MHNHVDDRQLRVETLPQGVIGTNSTDKPRWTIGRALRVLLLVIVPVLVLAGGLSAFVYMRATKPKVVTERPQERARLVDVVIVRRGTVTPSLRLYGQIAARRSVDLRALVAGEITAVAPGLVEGGSLKAGESVLQIDPFAYEGAVVRATADLAETRGRVAEIDARVAQERAALARGEEQAGIAERDNARLRQLVGSGVTTQRALDDSSLRLSQSQAALEQRQNQMAIYRAQVAQLAAIEARQGFALRQAERNLADVALKAPFDAIVSNAAADVGKLVNVNDRIATLIAVDALEVRFSLAASQYTRLTSDGQSLQDRKGMLFWATDRMANAARSGHAVTVSRVAAQASGGSYDVFARFDAEAPAALRPGSFVEIAITDLTFSDAIALPPTALQDGHVFVVSDNRLRRVLVEIVSVGTDQAVVRGSLPDGVLVVATPLDAPVDGQLVSLRNRPAMPAAGPTP
jgi:multidrug efflux system membrane fusion protein